MSLEESVAAQDTERTPLIDHGVVESQATPGSTSMPTKNLASQSSSPNNWRPIIVLLLLNAVQPLAYELVFPFINQMLVELHVVDGPEQVGFYSGLIESIFSITSFITILPLSFATDRYGRKPIILIGMTGLGISLLFFGMSQSYLSLILSRCIGGGMGGVWAAVKVMLGELTDKSTQDQAFVAMMVSYRIGQIVGLPMGGFLAHPERHWPEMFDTSFWLTYPFGLPCFVGAGFAFVSVLGGMLFLPETLYRPKKQRVEVTVHADETGNVVPEIQPTPPQNVSSTKTSWRLIMTRDIIALLVSNFLNCLSSELLFSVYSLFAFTSIESGSWHFCRTKNQINFAPFVAIAGGLGFSEAQIGASLAIRAFVQIGIMFLYGPTLAHPWIGAGSVVRLYKLAMFVWPISCVCYPILNMMARGGMDVNGVVFWAWMCGFFVIWSLAGLSWPAISIMSNNATPSAEALATVNAITQMSLIVPEGFAPAISTSLFAYCAERQLLNGYLQWVIFAIITSVAAIQSLMLKEPTHDWREDARVAREANATPAPSQPSEPPSDRSQ
ncbi:MFS general substrate transporter [Clavulina sp. PMI_390]|nr:MFS general substrate transporter [Clavulina sp. PMI_390]